MVRIFCFLILLSGCASHKIVYGKEAEARGVGNTLTVQVIKMRLDVKIFTIKNRCTDFSICS